MVDSASSISVCVRVRPFTVREAAQLSHAPDGPVFLGDGSLAGAPTPKLSQKGLRSVIKVVDDKCLVFDPPEDNPIHRFSKSLVPQGKKVKDQTFAFDRIFDENVSQGDVYEGTTRKVLDSVLDGYNATVFAYGATGCGKTHTITGTVQQPGIIFLTMQELFERIGERSDDKVTEISLSYLEIYNETIRDLLVPGGSKQGLMLREDSHQAVSVAGLSSYHPKDVQAVMDLIVRGNEYRTMSPTEANATSSRSHAVLQINISQRDRNASIDEPHTMATLSIIDLAGSERASATKNRGARLTEGANINKSLLALGSCINALCDPRKKNHVPYRNSKLTRLLKFSLGGNCRTVMIVCVSPSSAHFDETQNTLRYANRAKNIQTKVTRNVFNVNRHVKDFLVKIDEQMALINELKAQQKDYESIAFAKFRKLTEKRDAVAREGIARIRTAYDNSAAERQEKASSMKKLRQVEKRIAMISAWVDAFDQIAEMQEDETLMQNLQAMRRTAQGILMELESSRHHFHQKIAKSNWERALDSALQNSVRQLNEADGQADETETSNLSREAEILKSMAEREALAAVAELDKSGDAPLVQVLLKAHFETMAAVQNLVQMDEDAAIQAAKGILSRILQSCSQVTSHVVKPDGGLLPVESFAPTKSGTPKRKKSSFASGTPLKFAQAAVLAQAPQIASTPIRGSPKRRKFTGSAKKGVSFSPRKSPLKIPKRVVRWRDDEQDGALAEFEKTPQKQPESSPEVSSVDQAMPPPPVSTLLPPADATEEVDSSPVPPPPESLSAAEVKPKNNRFQSGFLLPKKASSPLSRSFVDSSTSASESDNSPLRDLEPSQPSNRKSRLRYSTKLSPPPSSIPESPRSPADSHPSGTENIEPSRSSSSSDTEESSTKPSKDDAFKIRSAFKRHSMATGNASSGVPTRSTHRRRSPTAASATGSPPNDGKALFTASHARRMVKKGERDSSGGRAGGSLGGNASVLSPRTQSVTKASAGMGATARRMTVSSLGGSGRDGPESGSRLSTVPAGGLRGSFAGGSKTAWR